MVVLKEIVQGFHTLLYQGDRCVWPGVEVVKVECGF